jgi:hypothetical protein
MTEALHIAIADLNDAGQRTPCQSPLGDYWTSDRDIERSAAIESCGYCPVLTHCSDYANEADERFHVWAGIDRNQKPRPAGRRTKATA